MSLAPPAVRGRKRIIKRNLHGNNQSWSASRLNKTHNTNAFNTKHIRKTIATYFCYIRNRVENCTATILICTTSLTRFYQNKTCVYIIYIIIDFNLRWATTILIQILYLREIKSLVYISKIHHKSVYTIKYFTLNIGNNSSSLMNFFDHQFLVHSTLSYNLAA